MSASRRWVHWIGWSVLGLGAAAGAAGLWVWNAARSRLARRYTTHDVEIPMPHGGSGPGDRGALRRAIERGRHLAHTRYACAHCHGSDMAGGTMIDDPAIGTWLGPNLTAGQGSRTVRYTMRDWDRIVRHGVKPDGTPAVMPSEDFVRMSDRELADIVAYIRSLPPVDREVPPPSFGPVGMVLVAFGKVPLTAERHAATAEHPPEPPEEAPTAAFGAHLAQTCRGCHGPDLAGGPIEFGPPDWPAAADLTPRTAGTPRWSYEVFERMMRTGSRQDGSRLRPPMTEVVRQAAHMKDTEIRALWTYLGTLPPGTDRPR